MAFERRRKMTTSRREAFMRQEAAFYSYKRRRVLLSRVTSVQGLHRQIPVSVISIETQTVKVICSGANTTYAFTSWQNWKMIFI